jgi:uncharacterized protein (TIGR03083 family)
MPGRPEPDEYAPFYAGYVAKVPDGDPRAQLARSAEETRRLFDAIGDERAGEPYAPGKWTVKDVVAHLADTERVMAYRALRIARGDATPLAGFDQDAYVRTAGASRRPLSDLLAELSAVRVGSFALFTALDAEAFGRRGTANGAPVSVRALLYIILGHEEHHRGLLRPLVGLAGAAAPGGRDG